MKERASAARDRSVQTFTSTSNGRVKQTTESTANSNTNMNSSTNTNTMQTTSTTAAATAATTAASNDVWRRFGQARRTELVEKDVLAGGTSFHLNENCRIQRYFQLSDRILVQFRQMASTNSTSDTEEKYIMGNRLVSFLATALPQHTEYKNTAVKTLAQKSIQDLHWMRQEMEALAVRIDEEQLNHYIQHDFDPVLDDLDDEDSDEDSTDNNHHDHNEDTDSDAGGSFSDLVDTTRSGGHHATSWETFEAGFAFDLSSGDEAAPFGTDTDVSSVQSHEANRDRRDLLRENRSAANRKAAPAPLPLPLPLPVVAVVVEKERTRIAAIIDHVADADIDKYVDLDPDYDDYDEDDCDEEVILRYSLKDSFATSILNRIADEDVCFETDSEAVDSWAQDGDSNALSGASSGTALTCDPARIAFREIMNRIPRPHTAYSKEEVGTPPPPPPVPPVPTDVVVTGNKNRGTTSAAVQEHGSKPWSKFASALARTAGEQ